MTTTYFVTGANRGIGLALTKNLSKDKNNFVFATARDAEKATALKALGDNVKVIQLDVLAPLEEIKKQLSVLGDAVVDVVFQNAGILIAGGETSVLTDLDNWSDQFNVNTLGSIKLYQAIFPYWSKASKAAKRFIFTSTAGGSLGAGAPFSCYGYGLSKAGINFFAREIANEHASLYPSNEGITNSITIVVNPGTVSTDMSAALLEQYKIPALTPEESTESIIAVVGELKPKDNGTFKDYDGAEHAW